MCALYYSKGFAALAVMDYNLFERKVQGEKKEGEES
jgi:hypothetical protein